MKKIRMRLVRGARGDAGFTLIELLVVIIIIALLAAIAIPTFLGQRQQAQDSAAFTLVRNALTAVQTAFVDTGDYSGVTGEMLMELEPSINWTEGAADVVVVGDEPTIDGSVVANAEESEVVFYPESATVIDIASQSESGNWFGVQIDSVDITHSGYVEVKLVDGEGSMGW